MPRGIVDTEGLNAPDVKALREMQTPDSLPFSINKIGHVVLMVQDLERSVEFYTQVLGFRVSDVYPPSMVPGRMVFMRCANDHHGVALVGGAEKPGNSNELNHMAFEVSTIDEVFRARDHLEQNGVKISYQGRRRAGLSTWTSARTRTRRRYLGFAPSTREAGSLRSSLSRRQGGSMQTTLRTGM